MVSMSLPIWKLNGTWPTAAVRVATCDRSTPGRIQQGFMMSMRKHRTLAFDGRVIFERQDELIGAGLQILAHVALARPHGARRREYIIE